jgi:hypothetical protein
MTDQDTFKIWPQDGKPIIVDLIDKDLEIQEPLWKLKRIKKNGGTGHTFEAYRLNLTPRNFDEIIATRILGRPLVPGEKIVHLDGDHLNNRRSNIQVMTAKEFREFKKKELPLQS